MCKIYIMFILRKKNIYILIFYPIDPSNECSNYAEYHKPTMLVVNYWTYIYKFKNFYLNLNTV